MSTGRTGGLAWEAAGAGVPVVLLHGFPLSRQIFGPIMPAMAQVCRVIAVDLPGFGESVPLPGGFSLADMARGVAGVIDDLCGKAAVFVGHSMGGYVALEVAAQKPEQVAGLVLLASHPRADTPEGRARRLEAIQAIAQGQKLVFVASFLDRLWSPWAKENAPRLLEEVRITAEAVPEEVLVGCLRAMAERQDHSRTLANLGKPVGVVVGDCDPLIPLELAQETAKLAPQGSLVVVPGAGHLPTLERPVFTAEALARFVGSVKA